MSTNPRFAFALEYVSDIKAVRQFYIDVLGLEVERDAPVFVQFKDSSGARYAIASDEARGERSDLELYWSVDDAEAAYADLSQKADISTPLTQMPFGKVFSLLDPAGQPRYLIEFAQNRPSQPAASTD